MWVSNGPNSPPSKPGQTRVSNYGENTDPAVTGAEVRSVRKWPLGLTQVTSVAAWPPGRTCLSWASVQRIQPGNRGRRLLPDVTGNLGSGLDFPNSKGSGRAGAATPVGARLGTAAPVRGRRARYWFSPGARSALVPLRRRLPPRSPFVPRPQRGAAVRAARSARTRARTHLGRAARRHPAARAGLGAHGSAAPGAPRPPRGDPGSAAGACAEEDGSSGSGGERAAPIRPRRRGRTVGWGAPPILDKGPGAAGTLVA